ncbi:MAG: nodulation efficiency protein D (NfeD), partial [Bacteroidales bacterium]|nr:nodulation efficiency protein D (NfeD) [Bacteroidales bacterium]
IDSRVNEIEEENFKVGDKGITITRLASAGIAEINNQRIEVYSITSYIDPKSEIEIDSIKDKRIFVKPIEQENI